MAHNTGPPMCKVCGIAHRWQDEHVWGAPKKTVVEKKSAVPAAVLAKTAAVKADRLAADAADPRKARVRLEELLAKDEERRRKQREIKARQREKRADFRHQGR